MWHNKRLQDFNRQTLEEDWHWTATDERHKNTILKELTELSWDNTSNSDTDWNDLDEQNVAIIADSKQALLTNTKAGTSIKVSETPYDETTSTSKQFIDYPIECKGMKLTTVWDPASTDSFITPEVVNALDAPMEAYPAPIKLHLASQGSQDMVTHFVKLRIRVNECETLWKFDVLKMKGRQVLIRNDFIHKHRVVLSSNPKMVVAPKSVSAAESAVTPNQTVRLQGEVQDTTKEQVEKFKTFMLKTYPEVFRSKSDPPKLPPKRDIQHTIPLLDRIRDIDK